MSLYAEYDHYNMPIGPDHTPYEAYEALRDEAISTDTPIGWSEKYDGFWVCAGWEEGAEIHRRADVFSNVQPNFPAYNAPGGRRIIMASYDGAEHKRYRNLVAAPFSPGSVAKLEGLFRSDTNLLIDRFIERGSVDISEELGAELPGRLTAIMLGAPAEAGAEYRSWVPAMAGHERFTDPEGSAAKMAAMRVHFEGLLEARRAEPGDDMFSALLNAQKRGETLSDQELEDFFAVLLFAGIDNTLHFLSIIFWRLGWDRELRRRLQRRPDLIPVAVEEFVRLYNTTMTVRTATEDVHIGGADIKAGEVVQIDMHLVNRDPRTFDYPDTFILGRQPNRHQGFGIGVHRCLGMHLLRLETRCVLEELLKRLPDWELDPAKEPSWVCGQVGGLVSVPVVFEPGKRLDGASA